jgi:Protein of unknown function (DUF1615)
MSCFPGHRSLQSETMTISARAALVTFACVALIASCASEPPPTGGGAASSPVQALGIIEQSVPKEVPDRTGWINDIYTGFSVQGLDATRNNVCAVVAVIEQESNFRTDPLVPGLGAIARKEIDTRAQRAGVPLLIVHSALGLRSPNGRTYGDRIDSARTEKQLSDIYEDFIGSVPLGRTLFADSNPIRTRGPMQVNIVYANQYAAIRHYPYPVKTSIADEVFTRRGSLYFGIAHLLAYQPPYDAYIFRFADFNAGQYASRNAAFQNATSRASGVPLVPDGTLLSDKDGTGSPGETERALRSMAVRLNLDQSEIHGALEQGKLQEFEKTALYERTFALAERIGRRPLPRAIIPAITLHGPKISRDLTTSWYAHRVEGRFERCLRK